MEPLEINVAQYGQVEGIADNIRFSLGLGLEEFQQGITAHDGTFVIVGSSPSLSTQIDAIREEKRQGRAICAVNGAYDFLVENGMTPNLFLTIDPRAMVGKPPREHLNNLRLPQKATIYAIASRCHPTTFEHLKNHKIILWHCISLPEEDALLDGRMRVGGGTTSGLRAIPFGYLQGFRKFHLYGMDSCLGEKGEKRYNTDTLPKAVKTIGVQCGDKEYVCNMAMAAQANEFQDNYDMLPDIHIEVFGGGLLAAIIEERKQKGLPT